MKKVILSCGPPFGLGGIEHSLNLGLAGETEAILTYLVKKYSIIII